MHRELDVDFMLKLTSAHPQLGQKVEMMRKWKIGQSMPSLRIILEVLNYHKVEPNALFREVEP